jgi:hypothetical protein
MESIAGVVGVVLTSKMLLLLELTIDLANVFLNFIQTERDSAINITLNEFNSSLICWR